eukprot:1010064-Pleurochrysis_carterae.AAC.1
MRTRVCARRVCVPGCARALGLAGGAGDDDHHVVGTVELGVVAAHLLETGNDNGKRYRADFESRSRREGVTRKMADAWCQFNKCRQWRSQRALGGADAATG